MAPEILQNESYNNKVDIWSLGILLFELIHGHSPFADVSIMAIYKNIILNNLIFDKKVHSLAKDLIKNILKIDP